MTQVSHLLDHKGRDVWSLAPDATVYEAIDQMAKKGVGALLIMEGERLVGIIRREYLDQILFWNGRDLEEKLEEFQDYYNAYQVPQRWI